AVLLLESGDAVAKQAVETATGEVAQAVQGKLKKDAPVLSGVQFVKFVVVDTVAGDQAHGCAAVTVFDTCKGFKVPAITVVIVPTTQHAPTFVQRPDRRHVSLFDAWVKQRRCIQKNVGFFPIAER